SVFSREGMFLICTSTYGQGDVPDNARALYDDLRAKRPNLSGVRYGVFGLGDQTYAETFNFGGKRFDDILTELGATRIGERFQHADHRVRRPMRHGDAAPGLDRDVEALLPGGRNVGQGRIAVRDQRGEQPHLPLLDRTRERGRQLY